MNADRKQPPMILADDFIEHHNIAWRVEVAA